ncbi:MAG: hypothetical protein KA419_17540 [Acidobacteria bacterium]|nr:hypothetical protein [Acidobacteriota bacterium]
MNPRPSLGPFNPAGRPFPSGRTGSPSGTVNRRFLPAPSAVAAVVGAALLLFSWSAGAGPIADSGPQVTSATPPKPTAESLTRRTLDLLKELTRVLGGAKGRATAMEAAPKIKEIAEAMRKLKEDAESLGPLQPGEGDRLRDKYQKEVTAVAEKLEAVVRRVMADPSIWEEIAPAMGELPPSILQGN